MCVYVYWCTLINYHPGIQCILNTKLIELRDFNYSDQCGIVVVITVVVLLFPQYGWTPLYAASKNGHTDAMKLLLEYKADVDNRDVVSSIQLSLGTVLYCVFACSF